MTEIIQYLLRHHESHQHTSLAVRVLQCLIYIENNIDEIATHAGKDHLRDPVGKLAFHLNNYETPKIARDELLKMVAEVRGVFVEIMAMKEEGLRHETMSIFLNNIRDNDAGCMEWRVRFALTHYAFAQTGGSYHINELYQEFDRLHPNMALTDFLDYFSFRVEYHCPVQDIDGNIKPLTWDLIKNYLKDTWELDDIDDFWITSFKTLCAPDIYATRRGGFYNFERESDARHYLAYIKSLLPQLREDLAPIEVDYFAKRNKFFFWLPTEAGLVFQHAIERKVAKEKEEETIPLADHLVKPKIIDMTIQDKMDEQEIQDARNRLRSHAIKFTLDGDFVIKSLRVDNRFFFRRFVEMVAPPFKKHKLREGNKKAYTVTGNGIYYRKSNQADGKYPIKAGQYTKEEKDSYSKNQSTSLGMRNFHPVPFAFSHRPDRLVGVIMDAKDILFSDRLYSYDGATLERPYDSYGAGDAVAYRDKKVNYVLFSKKKLAAFKNKITQPGNRDKHNEALVRMRWNADGSSKVFIGEDSLYARLWAQELARIMKNHLVMHHIMQDSHSIPICYYLVKDEALHLLEYSAAEQQLDRLCAYQIYSDITKRHQAYEQCRFEILFSLPPEQLVDVFKEDFSDSNLIIFMLLKGYTHIIPSLLEISGDKSNELLSILAAEIKNIRRETQDHGKIWKILHECYRTQQYELAKFIIEHTSFEEVIAPVPSNHFIEAAEQGHAEFIELILEYATNIEDNQRKGIAYWMHIALCNAASLGKTNVIKAILKHRKFTGLIDYINEYPLVIAASHGYIEACILLLAEYASHLNRTDPNGATPLIAAANNGYTDVVKLLLSNPHTAVNHQARLRRNYTALMAAIQNGYADTAIELLKDPRTQTDCLSNIGDNALTIAIAVELTDVIKALLRHSVKVVYPRSDYILEALGRLSITPDYASDLKTFLLEKYLPDYIERRSQGDDYHHFFYGRVFGQSKKVKIDAAQALMNGNDLKKHQKAFKDGELESIYHLLQNCEKTISTFKPEVVAPSRPQQGRK